MKTVKNAFKNRKIRNKIFYTLLILILFRVGCYIAVPGTTPVYSGLETLSAFSLLNMLGGGALERMSIFAMGVSPYITGSIIIELLSHDVIPALSEARKSGPKGRTKIELWTRYLGIILSFAQSYSIVYGFDKNYKIMENSNFIQYLYVATVLTAGTMVLIWLGDRINEKGIGNGLSMLIFAGIAANIPNGFVSVFKSLFGSEMSMWLKVLEYVFYVAVYFIVFLGIIYFELAERKVPVKYTRNMNGFGATASNIPIRPAMTSVIPVIFAQSIITTPEIILSYINYNWYEKVTSFLSFEKPFGLIIYIILVFAFVFFYADMNFDTDEVSKNLNSSGAFILKVKPGHDTKVYLDNELKYVMWNGAIGLAIVAAIPYLIAYLPNISSSSGLIGTGMIVAIGVAMETARQIESELEIDKYSGRF